MLKDTSSPKGKKAEKTAQEPQDAAERARSELAHIPQEVWNANIDEVLRSTPQETVARVTAEARERAAEEAANPPKGYTPIDPEEAMRKMDQMTDADWDAAVRAEYARNPWPTGTATKKTEDTPKPESGE